MPPAGGVLPPAGGTLGCLTSGWPGVLGLPGETGLFGLPGVTGLFGLPGVTGLLGFVGVDGTVGTAEDGIIWFGMTYSVPPPPGPEVLVVPWRFWAGLLPS